MDFVWSFLLSAFFVGIIADEVPEYIQTCRRKDPHVDECVNKAINHLRGYLVKGIDELGVPSIEPLIIPKIQLENGVGRIRVKAAFSNMTIHGASNNTITNIKSSVKDYRIDIGAKLPKLSATGRYEVSGTVLVVNIRSKGDFWAAFDDLSGIARIQAKEVFQQGVKYLKIEKVAIDFKVGKARFRIKDRSSNSKVLGEAINNFLNQNYREVIEEMKPTASGAIAKYVKNLLNTAFLKLPLDKLLIDD